MKVPSFIAGVLVIGGLSAAQPIDEPNGVVSLQEQDSLIAREAAAGRLRIIDPTKEKSTAVLPAAFDRSIDKAFPPIGSQVGGSCTGWSTTYYSATFQVAKREGWNAQTGGSAFWCSPQWTYNYVNGGADNGGNMPDNNAMMISHGVATWLDFPQGTPNRHTSWCTDPAIYRKAIKFRMLSQAVITNVNTLAGLQALKEAVYNSLDGVTYATNSPSSGSQWVFTTVKDNPDATIDDPAVGQVACSYVLSNRGGLHAMAVCGWNDSIWIDVNQNGIIDAGEIGALKVPNSHGTSTGTKGFYWLAYDALNPTSQVVNGPTDRDPAMLQQRAYVLQFRPSYAPSMFAQFTLQTAARIDVVLKFLRVKQTATAPYSSPDASWQGYVFGTMSNAAGNRLGFDGNDYSANPDAAPDGSFAFDLTGIFPAQGTPAATWRYVMSVQDRTSGLPVTVKSFQIIVPNQPDSVFTCQTTPITVDNATNYLFIDVPYTPTGVIANRSIAPATDLTITNMFGRRTGFAFHDQNRGSLVVQVYTVAGRKVWEQRMENGAAGSYRAEWCGPSGSAGPSAAASGGMYVARLVGNNQEIVKKFSIF
jgi:hypothetical protein